MKILLFVVRRGRKTRQLKYFRKKYFILIKCLCRFDGRKYNRTAKRSDSELNYSNKKLAM